MAKFGSFELGVNLKELDSLRNVRSESCEARATFRRKHDREEVIDREPKEGTPGLEERDLRNGVP